MKLAVHLSLYIIRPHHSLRTQMLPVVTDRVVWSICRSVMIVSPVNMAELIQMLFGLWTQVGPTNHVLDGVQIPHVKGQF